jgi:hypothetical protein
MRTPVQQGNTGNRFWAKSIGRLFYEFFAGFWWGARTLWWDLWWSRSVRVVSWVMWLASLIVVIVERSHGALFLFELASGVTVVLWVIPLIWGAYRLYVRVRPPVRAGWCYGDAGLSKDLRSDWMQQIRDLGFSLAGHLTKDCDDPPVLALYIDPIHRDSAHVARVTGKDLLVFKTRFEDGFAFETSSTPSIRLFPTNPQHPTFRFPQLRRPSDLYRVHQRIRSQVGSEREPVISDEEGEVAEFISRAEVVRSHMMSRDYRQTTANYYMFRIRGALRHAALLAWPVKPIREAMFRRKALNEITRLGLRVDKGTGRIVGR